MAIRSGVGAFLGGLVVAVLGGLIGLGGAEFRLPLLIGLFGLAALPAVIVNKALSLVVVASSLPFRASSVPLTQVFEHGWIIALLLAGSLYGAWIGADWATRLGSRTLHRVLAGLLLLIAFVLLFGHEPDAVGRPLLTGMLLAMAGVAAGFAIGLIAALMGVAGGELLIPTIVLLFGADLKLAGSLSLAVSLPTMLVGFARYSRDQSFAVLWTERRFVGMMGVGSLVGAFIGGRLLGLISTDVLLPLLAVILMVSAVKVWQHR